ncbi:MAG: hypothetical protein PHS92_05290 [Candidatus Gracilibacteria bacterium]|nr:hypothetical protein [Candidatus Gracilibacteria bacterium]
MKSVENNGNFVPSERDMTGLIEHIIYEIEMLYISMKCFKNKELSIYNSIFIENFLIHERNLMDFFGKKTRCKKDGCSKCGIQDEDDALCLDFGFNTKKFDYKTKQKINKSLSHISYSRNNGNNIWDIKEMGEQMLIISGEFLLLLKSKRYIINGDNNYQRIKKIFINF